MQGARGQEGAPTFPKRRVPADAGISVVIPAYNVEGFIAAAVESVMAQTRPVQEILVTDDGSTDGTAAWLGGAAARDCRFRLLRTDRKGPSAARNLGLAAATQPIIAFLDGDDVWPRDKVAVQMQRMAAADFPDAVSGHIRRFTRAAPEMPTGSGGEFPDMVHVNLGACLFRREVFDRIGLFDEGLRLCEDVDLMFRFREAGLRLVIMREITLYYRIRPGSLTQSQAGQEQQKPAVIAALRHTIGRRRRGGPATLAPFTSQIDT